MIRAHPDVRSAAPFVLQQVMLSHGESATGVVLRGIDPETERRELQQRVKQGSLADLAGPEPSIALGRELARTLGAFVGDTVVAISPRARSPRSARSRRCARSASSPIFEIGLYEYDSALAYTSIETAQQFAEMGARVSGIEVRLNDVYQARRVSREIGAKLGMPYWTRDWTEMNRNLFSAIQLEKTAMFVILTLIIFVAAFAIISHLILMVAEKRREIGVLRALGASGRSITLVFMAEGVLIGLVGTVVGTVLGRHDRRSSRTATTS